MKKILIGLFLFTVFQCYGDVNKEDVQKFLKEYWDAQEKGEYYWSEIAYAIEKDYDEIAFFCIENLPLGAINYEKGKLSGKQCVYVYNLFCRCVIKNKYFILDAILNKYPEIKPNGSEFVRACFHPAYGKFGNYKIRERQMLNIAIEEEIDSLKFVKLLADFGADLNLSILYDTGELDQLTNNNRTPLQAAILKNKLDVVEFLLEKKVDPNTGLQIAVETCNKEALILLLNYGADPYYINGFIIKKTMELGFNELVDILTAVYFSDKS